MMTQLVPFDARRRKALSYALARALPPSKLTMASELLAAENRGRTPQPEEILHWMRLNMPLTAARVEEYLHPAD